MSEVDQRKARRTSNKESDSDCADFISVKTAVVAALVLLGALMLVWTSTVPGNRTKAQDLPWLLQTVRTTAPASLFDSGTAPLSPPTQTVRTPIQQSSDPQATPSSEQQHATTLLSNAPGSSATQARNDRLEGTGPMLADLVVARLSSDYLWPTLMDQIKPQQRADLLVVEVGAFDGFQATLAAQRGFGLIVLEPSPKNFKRVLKRMGVACPTVSACNTKRGVQIFNVAGSSHNHTLLFASKGGTGDHALGEGGAIALGEEEVYAGSKRRAKPGSKPTVVSVPALPLDHFLANNTGVFITKIDVQDHEPPVLSGMKECIAKKVSDFILIEFRPQGWHHMFPHLDPSKVLDTLCAADSGYVCYFLNRSQQGNWNDFEWQFSMDEWIVPNETATTSSLVSRMYAANAKRKDRFGIWTDICAVADRPSAWTVLNLIVSVECQKNKGNFTVMSNGRPQCRPPTA